MAEGLGEARTLSGMDGFVVLVMGQIDGEWWLLVETFAVRATDL
jgi:hypothetical protein